MAKATHNLHQDKTVSLKIVGEERAVQQLKVALERIGEGATRMQVAVHELTGDLVDHSSRIQDIFNKRHSHD